MSIDGGPGTDFITGTQGADILNGFGGNDRLNGNPGADTLNGGDGDDTLYDGALTFTLDGVASHASDQNADTLNGDGGDDTIYAGAGDSVNGGPGFDRLFMSWSLFFQGFTLDLRAVDAGLTASVPSIGNSGGGFFQIPNGAVISGVELVDVTLSEGADTFYGLSASDTVNGGGGDDSIDGGDGSDVLEGGSGSDTLIGGNGDDRFGSSSPSPFGTGFDTHVGGAGNDISFQYTAGSFDGGDGFDTANYLLGGTFTVDLRAMDSGGGGSVAGTGLLRNVEAVSISAFFATITFFGSNLPETVSLMTGKVVAFGGGANDRLFGSTASSFDDTLSGEDGDDLLTGYNGSDSLDGGLGVDTLIGGAGDDQYVVDNVGDEVTELVGEGRDTIYTSVGSLLGGGEVRYTLAANIDDLATNGISSAINLYGNALANLIVGNGAVNTLDGQAGADTMVGGAGDDQYLVEDVGDLVLENPGEGRDTIYISISFYQIGDNAIEDVAITGTGGSYVTGNALANLMVGNTGNDTFEGKAGADTLVGGAGDDSYLIGDQDDVIIESVGSGGGRDTIYTSISFYQMGDNVEDLSMTGTGGTYGIGNGVDNLIVGTRVLTPWTVAAAVTSWWGAWATTATSWTIWATGLWRAPARAATRSMRR